MSENNYCHTKDDTKPKLLQHLELMAKDLEETMKSQRELIKMWQEMRQAFEHFTGKNHEFEIGKVKLEVDALREVIGSMTCRIDHIFSKLEKYEKMEWTSAPLNNLAASYCNLTSASKEMRDQLHVHEKRINILENNLQGETPIQFEKTLIERVEALEASNAIADDGLAENGWAINSLQNKNSELAAQIMTFNCRLNALESLCNDFQNEFEGKVDRPKSKWQLELDERIGKLESALEAKTWQGYEDCRHAVNDLKRDTEDNHERIVKHFVMHQDHYANHEQLKKEFQLLVQGQDRQCEQIDTLQKLASELNTALLDVECEVGIEELSKSDQAIKTKGLTFAEAIEAMKQEKYVTRSCWKKFRIAKGFDTNTTALSWEDAIATDWEIVE